MKIGRMKVTAILLASVTVGVAFGLGCSPCPLTFAGMLVRGSVETDSQDTLGDFVVDAYTWTGDTRTASGSTSLGYSDNNFTWQDGTFQISLASPDRVAVCDDPFSAQVEVPEYPVPDEVHLVITHDGCEYTFEIQVTADMLTDYDYPEYDILQLTEPLVIGACPEE